MEAEKLRHGQKAVAMVGLMNESTGSTVDMDAPVERYARLEYRSDRKYEVRLDCHKMCEFTLRFMIRLALFFHAAPISS